MPIPAPNNHWHEKFIGKFQVLAYHAIAD